MQTTHAVFTYSLVAFLLTISQLSGQNINWHKTDKEVAVDNLFKRWNSSKSTGAVIAIIDHDRIIYLQGYGSANLEYQLPNDPQKSVFQVASVAKQFTSFCLLLLEQQGKLSLEDDIRKYIPEVPDFGHTITLRHLATHTSGIRDQWNLLKLAGWRMDDVINNDHVFRLIKRQKALNFPPGNEFRYSNTGHTLLAEVVARVSGQSFVHFAKENIFTPLEMHNSFFMDDHEKVVKNLASSYDGDQEEGFRKSVLCISSVGATNLFTTAEDMAKWAINFNTLHLGGEDLIERLNKVPYLNDGSLSEYALGQFPIIYKGLKAYEHSGAEAAYESYFIRFPEPEFAVAVLSNNGAFWAEGIGRKIADIYLREMYEEQKLMSAAKRPQVIPPVIELSESVLQKFTGKYWCPTESMQREIQYENGELHYIRNVNSKTALFPIGNTEFAMKDIPNSTLEFRFDQKGIYQLILRKDDEQLLFIPIQTVKLKEYVGSYYSEELDTYYHIEEKGEQLLVRHRRIPDILLSPITENLFHSRTWFFKNIQFERDSENHVIGFNISNRGVSDLHFRKH